MKWMFWIVGIYWLLSGAFYYKDSNHAMVGSILIWLGFILQRIDALRRRL